MQARRKYRVKRSGIQNQAQRPPLSSILIANLHSLGNKLDAIRGRIRFHGPVMFFVWRQQRWPYCCLINSFAQPSPLFWVDWREVAGKSKGGGFAPWPATSGALTILIISCSCSPSLELLTTFCNPFYLPWEFIITAFWILAQVEAEIALYYMMSYVWRCCGGGRGNVWPCRHSYCWSINKGHYGRRYRRGK